MRCAMISRLVTERFLSLYPKLMLARMVISTRLTKWTKGLAALPEQNRNLVKSVQINPDRNPDDTYWEKQYNTPGFRSYMTRAGVDGIRTVMTFIQLLGVHKNMPRSMSINTYDYTRGRRGHIGSGQNWGNDNDKRWDDWNKAIKSDPTGIDPQKWMQMDLHHPRTNSRCREHWRSINYG